MLGSLSYGITESISFCTLRCTSGNSVTIKNKKSKVVLVVVKPARKRSINIIINCSSKNYYRKKIYLRVHIRWGCVTVSGENTFSFVAISINRLIRIFINTYWKILVFLKLKENLKFIIFN